MALMIIQVIAASGFLLSLYSIYVELKKSKSKYYLPVCDISDTISCTKAFTSKYSRIAFLPNSVYGIVFYLLIFILAVYGQIAYIFYLSVMSLISSFYLAYLMYFKVRSFCLICNSIYVISIFLFVFSYASYFI